MMMGRGIATWAWLLAVALLAACGRPTDEDLARATLTAMSGAAAQATTPAPAADTPVPATNTPAQPFEGGMCQGRIAFIRRDAGSVGIYTVRADGGELTEVLADVGSTYSLSWSRGGTRGAYAAQVSGSYGVFVFDRRGLVRRLSVGGSGSDLAWSPNGEQIVLNDWEGLGTELYVVDAESGESRQLTDSVSHKTGPAWSPDGRWIAFTMLDGRNQGDVWVMPAPGGAGGPVNLTQHPANDCCVAWSPDSTRLAFLSSRTDEGTQPAGSLVRTGYGMGPRAGASGPRPLTTVVPEPPQDVYLVDPDGGGLRKLTGSQGHVRDLAWSPDGRWLAYVSDRHAGQEIYLIDVAGGEEARLTQNDWRDFAPVWSPDGACLAFVSYRQDAYGIYLLAVPAEPGAEPGEPWKLVEGGTSSGGFGWSP